MKPLLPFLIATLLFRCATHRDTDIELTVASSCKPLKSLEGVAGADLYQSQAALPCLQAYRNAQDRPNQDADLAVAVAISGGGYRAANFAIGVMLGLEAIQSGSNISALEQVDYFSTVSGGGLAAAAYIAALHSNGYRAVPSQPRVALAYVMLSDRERLRRNLYPYLRRAILPGMGRNEALHKQFDQLTYDPIADRSLKLADVFKPTCELGTPRSVADCYADPTSIPRLPFWFANATVAKNGAIFPFSPDMLASYGVEGYRHRRDERYAPYDMPLSVGLTASATFPGGIPPLTLCVRGECGDKKAAATLRGAELQLLDGGVSDNLGVLTALAVLAQDSSVKKTLIVIDAYIGTDEPLQSFADRLSTLNVLRRTTSIYLDSWRGRHRHVVAAMAKGLARNDEDWNVIFISFDDLRKTDPQLHSAVRSIGTNFAISAEQQQQLIDAGMCIVQAKRESLCRGFLCGDGS